MLRRGALVLFLIVGLGIAAILAAGSFGITWPWQQQTAEGPLAPGSQGTPSAGTTPSQSAAEPSKSPDANQAAKAIEETTAALSPAQPAEAPKQGSVALDISRISPDGPSVFAGRAEPDSYVTVLENGKPAGTVQADANGDWSLSTEHRFASTDPSLTFEASATPPAAPAPPAAEAPKVAEKPAEPAQGSAAVVANDVMKKFEDLVAKAREEAKAEQQAKAEEESKTQTEDATKAAPEPDAQQHAQGPVGASPAPESTPAPMAKAEPPARGTESSSSGAERATASTGSSAGSAASASPNARQDGTTAKEPATVTAQAPIAPGSQTGKTEAIPVPIMFVYNEATLTPDGQRAANLLLEYLTLKHLSAVELTGHADERGTSEYNMDLSRDRLATVSDLLKDGGYSGELKLTPKGKSEPFMGVDRERYSGEALYQLDRRVELRVAR